jgi:hypothetical protein
MLGCPIRKSPDQCSFDSSPELIAAYHVLHRLSTPRHPPCTLSNLIAWLTNSRPPTIANQGTFDAIVASTHVPSSRDASAPRGPRTLKSFTSLRLPLPASSSARRLNSPDAAGCDSTYSIVKEHLSIPRSRASENLSRPSPLGSSSADTSEPSYVSASIRLVNPLRDFFGSFFRPLLAALRRPQSRGRKVGYLRGSIRPVKALLQDFFHPVFAALARRKNASPLEPSGLEPPTSWLQTRRSPS